MWREQELMTIVKWGRDYFLVKHLTSPILIIDGDERWSGKGGGEREDLKLEKS